MTMKILAHTHTRMGEFRSIRPNIHKVRQFYYLYLFAKFCIIVFKSGRKQTILSIFWVGGDAGNAASVVSSANVPV